MTLPTNKEIESFSNYKIDAIKSLRLKNKRPNNESIFDHISKTSATNIDQDFVDIVLTTMLDKNLIYNKPTVRGSSYYIRGDNEISVDIDTSEKDTGSKNISQVEIIDIIDNENQRQANIFEYLKAEILALKKYVKDELNEIKSMKHQEEVQFLREENKTKNTITNKETIVCLF